MQGSLKWFDSQKGFGFIECQETDQDVFVHHTGISDDFRNRDDGRANLKEGQIVQFEIETDPKIKKQHAVNVRKVKSVS